MYVLGLYLHNELRLHMLTNILTNILSFVVYNVQHLNSNKLRDRLVIQKECSRPQKKMQDVGLKIVLRNTVQVSSA